jgi:hypothetical protein
MLAGISILSTGYPLGNDIISLSGKLDKPLTPVGAYGHWISRANEHGE